MTAQRIASLNQLAGQFEVTVPAPAFSIPSVSYFRRSDSESTKNCCASLISFDRLGHRTGLRKGLATGEGEWREHTSDAYPGQVSVAVDNLRCPKN